MKFSSKQIEIINKIKKLFAQLDAMDGEGIDVVCLHLDEPVGDEGEALSFSGLSIRNSEDTETISI